jgi:hypothetical protein
MLAEDYAMGIFIDYLKIRLQERIRQLARSNQLLSKHEIKQISDELAADIVLEFGGETAFVDQVKELYDGINAQTEAYLRANKPTVTNPPEHRKYKHRKAN